MSLQTQPEFILAGVSMKRLLSGAETGGGFCLFENRSDGNSRTPVHLHAGDDETVYVIEGEMQAILAGQTKTIRPGEAVFLPRGIPHQLLNVSGQPVRYMLICVPSGFEGFVAEGGRPREPGEPVLPPTAADSDRMKEAAPRYGITILPGW